MKQKQNTTVKKVTAWLNAHVRKEEMLKTSECHIHLKNLGYYKSRWGRRKPESSHTTDGNVKQYILQKQVGSAKWLNKELSVIQ